MMEDPTTPSRIYIQTSTWQKFYKRNFKHIEVGLLSIGIGVCIGLLFLPIVSIPGAAILIGLGSAFFTMIVSEICIRTCKKDTAVKESKNLVVAIPSVNSLTSSMNTAEVTQSLERSFTGAQRSRSHHSDVDIAENDRENVSRLDSSSASIPKNHSLSRLNSNASFSHNSNVSTRHASQCSSPISQMSEGRNSSVQDLRIDIYEEDSLTTSSSKSSTPSLKVLSTHYPLIDDDSTAQASLSPVRPCHASPPIFLEQNEQRIKQKIIINDIVGVINEIYTSNIKFSNEMQELQAYFLAMRNPLTNKINRHAKKYAEDLKGCTSSPFANSNKIELKPESSDINNFHVILINVENIINILKSKEFELGLKARELGTINIEWISKFQKDRNKMQERYNNDENKSLISADLIKPCQQNPRYILFIKELIKQIEKLTEAYQNNSQDEIQKKLIDLNNQKKLLLLEQGKINNRIISLNSIVVSATLNRKIEYVMRKYLTIRQVKTFKSDLNRLNDADDPPTFIEVYQILKKTRKITTRFMTKKYITEISAIEAARMHDVLERMDRKTDEYQLKKINYEIAIYLLKSISVFGAVIQDKIIEFINGVITISTLQPQELLQILNMLDLKKMEKLKTHNSQEDPKLKFIEQLNEITKISRKNSQFEEKSLNILESNQLKEKVSVIALRRNSKFKLSISNLSLSFSKYSHQESRSKGIT